MTEERHLFVLQSRVKFQAKWFCPAIGSYEEVQRWIIGREDLHRTMEHRITVQNENGLILGIICQDGLDLRDGCGVDGSKGA